MGLKKLMATNVVNVILKQDFNMPLGFKHQLNMRVSKSHVISVDYNFAHMANLKTHKISKHEGVILICYDNH